MRYPFRRPAVGIHPATLDEAEAMADIYERAFKRAWSALEFEGLLSEPACIAFSARRTDSAAHALVGFAMARLGARQARQVQSQPEAELLAIAVDFPCRRLGLGRRLMANIASQANKRGAQRLVLEVQEQNAAALSLYRGLGFTKIDERRNHAQQGVAWIMARNLD